jgi:glyoxylase-like metal-dependent hydrolase (beta-lactamase superfamily II)
MRVKRIALGLVAVALVLTLLKYFLLDTSSVPLRSRFSIDLPAMHALAARNGDLPERIEVTSVGDYAVPRTAVMAGGGFAKTTLAFAAYRVVWPDRSLIIDTAMSGADLAEKFNGSRFDLAHYQSLQAAMQKAQSIIFTHEHPDHVGGLARAPDWTLIRDQVKMTREQLTSPRLMRTLFDGERLAQLTPLTYEGLYAVAPGVVLMKAPGHSPGSQLIYVELGSGEKFLFIGDIAWSLDNVRELTGKPRLVSAMLHENRTAVAEQLRALHDLNGVHLVSAHDEVEREADVASGLMRDGFSE